MYNPLDLKLFLFLFYPRCYSSVTPDDSFVYLSFSLLHFLNISIVNMLMNE